MRAIPTIYAGVQFKSRLEADTAFLLDALGLPWQYEPQSYLLADGTHYWPDFWCERVRLWVEARGYETEKGERQLRGFRVMVEGGEFGPCDYMTICPTETSLYELGPETFGSGGAAAVVRCAECSRWFFIGEGSFYCRHCGAHDGNRHHADVWDIAIIAGRLRLYRPDTPNLSVREFAERIGGKERAA